MAVGLIVLGALALLIFFGVTDKLFERAGIGNWIAFLMALGLALSVLIPDVRFGTPPNLALSVSGFLLPAAIAAVLLIIAAVSRRFLLSLYSIICVAAAVIVIRLAVPPATDVLAISGGIVTGIVAGILAHAVGRTRLATVTGAVGGIILGDALSVIVYNAYSGQGYFRLGGLGVFDAIVIGAVFSLIFAEVVGMIRRAARAETGRTGRRRAANFEAGEDVADGKDGGESERKANPGCHRESVGEAVRPKYKDYFEE